MADLDDFFAKKDRKKAKGKKFTTTEEVAKKLEETGKRTEKMKSKEKPINPESEETPKIEDEDEWKEFEIEEKKDLRGLKIGNLSVKETVDVESDDERRTGDNSSDGETVENIVKSGPWKKPEVPQQQEEIVEVPTAPTASTPATTAPAAPTSMHSYVPPHLRNPTAMTSSAPRSRVKNAAPDIHSEEYFPTLSSKPQSNESTGPWGRRKREEGTFEEVRNRGGSRSYSMQESQAQTPKLSLGNKYGALSQDQS